MEGGGVNNDVRSRYEVFGAKLFPDTCFEFRKDSLFTHIWSDQTKTSTLIDKFQTKSQI